MHSVSSHFSPLHGAAGYGGFIPEASSNKQATEQADLRKPRLDAYSPGQLLFGLDQWSRRRHPDYTGWFST